MRRRDRWTDRRTGLEVRCVSVEYTDFPVVEWTVYFKNTGNRNTAILEDIQGAELTFATNAKGDPRLHYIEGDGGFAPREATLKANDKLQFSPNNGRPTDGCFPCYNLDLDGRGVILAVGWPGQWESSISRDAQGGVRFRARQQSTHFVLHPGEEARSVLAVLLFWDRGDWVRRKISGVTGCGSTTCPNRAASRSNP